MKNAIRHVGRRANLGAGLAGLALLAMPSLATSQEETWSYAGASVIPGNPLVSFDISWVDPTINRYFLSDRSNFSIDVMPIQPYPPVFKIIPAGVEAFAGFTGNNGTSGPNGIMTLTDPGNGEGLQLWAGDGPTPNPQCGASQPSCGTVKVFTGQGGSQPVHVVPTSGIGRADELCFIPPTVTVTGVGYVVIASDADTPPFISFIPTSGPQAYKVSKVFTVPEASNGIGQCKFDPGGAGEPARLYVNVPEVNGNGTDSVPGEILVFNPVNLNFLGRTMMDFTDCAGNQGMAIGYRVGPVVLPATPSAVNDDILIGCNAKGGNGRYDLLVIESPASVPAMVTPAPGGDLPNLGGADEVWFEALAAQHYASGSGSFPSNNQVPIIDANSTPPFQTDANFVVGFSANSNRKAHSVAGWSGNAPVAGHVTAFFVPIPAAGGGTAPFTSQACTSAAALGCIAYYATFPVPTGTDTTNGND